MGEQVECTQGIGTVEALDADGTITIKLSHGKIVTFTSQGATLSLSFSRLCTAIRLKYTRSLTRSVLLRVHGVQRARPRGRASEARRRLVAPRAEGTDRVEGHQGSRTDHPRRCPGSLPYFALPE